MKKILVYLLAAFIFICVNPINVKAQYFDRSNEEAEIISTRRIRAAQMVVSTCYTSIPGNGIDAVSGADSNNIFSHFYIVYENVQTITYHRTIRQTGNYRMSKLPNGNLFVKWEYEIDGVRMYF